MPRGRKPAGDPPSVKRVTEPPGPASPASDLPAAQARGLKAHSEPIAAHDPSDGAMLSPSSLPYGLSVLPARQAAAGNPGLGYWRSAASNRRSRSRRTERHRAAARLWPRLSLLMTATRQSLRLDATTHSRHHPNDPLGDATPAAFRSEWWPLSNRNRWPLSIGIPGRLHRNPQQKSRPLISTFPSSVNWRQRSFRSTMLSNLLRCGDSRLRRTARE
jgi:hypothetical protein